MPDYEIFENEESLEFKEGIWLKSCEDGFSMQLFDALIGKKIGAQGDIEITLPDNYKKDIAGKKVKIHLFLKEIRRKILQKIDELFEKVKA